MKVIRAFYCWFLCALCLIAKADIEPDLSANPKFKYGPGQAINYAVSLKNTGLLPTFVIDLGMPMSTITPFAHIKHQSIGEGYLVLGDKLFDTGSIIGKVFEDHNGNGYQSDATAKNIRVWVDIPMGDYVPESTVLKYGKQRKPQVDKNSILFRQGLEISTLWGESYQADGKSQSATVIYKSIKGLNYPVHITSKTGSDIRFKRNGAVSKKVRGNLAKGLNSEDLHVTTKVFKEATAFRHEIEITNKGKYDDGIPGVRLITAEGFKLETDEHGRFHVPDRWILDSKGSNFLIKLDTDSLPARMHVISENPKILRISPNKLNNFNFSVQRH